MKLFVIPVGILSPIYLNRILLEQKPSLMMPRDGFATFLQLFVQFLYPFEASPITWLRLQLFESPLNLCARFSP